VYDPAIAAADIPHSALDLPGAALQELHTEPGGSMTVPTHPAAGATIQEHWHTHADETAYVLPGDFVGRAGTRHGRCISVHGCIVLTRFSAPLDFQLVDPAYA
jgi:hypothetical protein